MTSTSNNSREQICLKISSLPLDCDIEHVRKDLEPLLLEAVSHAEEMPMPDSVMKDISPLMVASDKGNVTCLHYLMQQLSSHTTSNNNSSTNIYYQNIIGKPLDRSSDALGGNSAVHHAASSGCHEALEMFHNYGGDEDRNIRYEQLGSITNAHGDTPLQVAVTAGHLSFLQCWQELALQEYADTTTNKNSNKYPSIAFIFETKNESHDTCLSLACCHGHLDILKYLIEQVHVVISHEEITNCQQAVARIVQSVKHCHVNDPVTLKTIQMRRDQMCQGLELLQQAYAQQVEQVAQDLMMMDSRLNEETTIKSDKKNEAVNVNKKTKKNKKNKKSNNKPKTDGEDGSASDYLKSADIKTAASSEDDPVRITTMSDGKLAISVPGETHHDHSISTQPNPMISGRQPQPSVHDMLRQRLHEGSIISSKDSEIDAVMDALCLDVSMLLYTPHGMALNLSPSQLDTVEQILSKQIAAVQEARTIQNRKHQQQQQSKSSSP